MCSKVTHNSLHVARAVTTEAHFSPYVLHVGICYTEEGNDENSVQYVLQHFSFEFQTLFRFESMRHQPLLHLHIHDP